MKGIVEYIGSRPVLEFKANRSTDSHRSLTDEDIRNLKVGDKLFLKSDLSGYPTDEEGNPIVGSLRIYPNMIKELGRIVTVTNIDSYRIQIYINLKETTYT